MRSMRRTMTANLILMLSLSSLVLAQTPLGTGFSYQGKLEQSGAVVDGSTDFQFRLFSAPTAGTQIGVVQQFFDVPVVDGLFTVALDFGATGFSGDARWLEIAMRSVDAAPFTTLSPRQTLTAVPYALKIPGIDGHSLNAADGSPSDVVSVDNAGLVSVTGNVSLAGERYIALNPNDTFSYDAASAGHYSLGWYSDSWNPAGATAWMSGYAGIKLFTAGVPRMSINGAGNVGVGTIAPAAKLDVHGDVKLGPSGQYFAAAGNENLRLVRGTIDSAGNVLRGSGFTAVRQSIGDYRITFNAPFQTAPSVTATVDDEIESFPNADFFVAGVYQASASSVRVRVRVLALNLSLAGPDNHMFHFCAIGPR